MPDSTSKYDTAESRWAGVGPYYAMFPADFANRVIEKYSSVGDTVLDPFAGRGTAVFSAHSKGRTGIGVELNPVGWVYSQVKLRPAESDAVLDRLKHIGRLARRRTSPPGLPVFFDWCFSVPVQRFLLVARKHLDWRRNRADRTLMALLLVNLHGKREAALSNQMRQTKSMSPDYAVNWWAERGMRPPELNPVEFMQNRIAWRYARGTPRGGRSFVRLGDSTECLPQVKARTTKMELAPASLLLTSPPYCGVTNYHYDQWLRLWLLGGPPHARKVPGNHRGKFYDRQKYRELLLRVFRSAKPLLKPEAVVYVRTDHRKVTLDITAEVLREVFPNSRMYRRDQPVDKPTQTHLFGNTTEKTAEVDLALFPKKSGRSI